MNTWAENDMSAIGHCTMNGRVCINHIHPVTLPLKLAAYHGREEKVKANHWGGHGKPNTKENPLDTGGCKTAVHPDPDLVALEEPEAKAVSLGASMDGVPKNSWVEVLGHSPDWPVVCVGEIRNKEPLATEVNGMDD